VIEVLNLKKCYGEKEAVKGISFSVEPGEVLGLVGPNGAGKTTTLRCLSGILPPTQGLIRIAGHDLRQDPVAPSRRSPTSPTTRGSSRTSPSRTT
jgi:ABC-2 type transport system ATP-binding protein